MLIGSISDVMDLFMFCLFWSLIFANENVRVQWIDTINSGSIDSTRANFHWSLVTELSGYGYDASVIKGIPYMVKACADTFVFLDTLDNATSVHNLYEIVIGSYSGSRVTIRRNGTTKREHNDGNLLDCFGFRSYWIYWNSTSFYIGKGLVLQQDLILSFPWDVMTVVRDVGIMTGFGSTGQWIFYLSDLGLSIQSEPLMCKALEQTTVKLGTTTSLGETTTRTDTTTTFGKTVVSTDLKIDKTTLSSYKRQRTSASDSRTSSTIIGVIGATVIVSVIVTIVVLDFCPPKTK